MSGDSFLRLKGDIHERLQVVETERGHGADHAARTTGYWRE
jgi:hypothetical protein